MQDRTLIVLSAELVDPRRLTSVRDTEENIAGGRTQYTNIMISLTTAKLLSSVS